MAEQKQEPKEKQNYERILRIAQTDIPGGKNIYSGLTRIKGVSWSFSNFICRKLNIDKNRKIASLTSEEIKKIQEFIRNPEKISFMLNRRKDYDTGEDTHLNGSDLELKQSFDIKRLKTIKSYKGVRHSSKLPVRGQRTRGHFRKKGKAVGVIKKKKSSKKG
jgi:small subunit ribosomal protein S13